jgi:hypothetical protein
MLGLAEIDFLLDHARLLDTRTDLVGAIIGGTEGLEAKQGQQGCRFRGRNRDGLLECSVHIAVTQHGGGSLNTGKIIVATFSFKLQELALGELCVQIRKAVSLS